MASFGVNVSFSAGLGTGVAQVGFGLGGRKDPLLAFGFLVEIEGLLAGGFTEVRGLEIETEVESYREGGRNDSIHKLPGPVRSPSNLVLRRGLTDSAVFWSWFQDVLRGKVDRRNGTVHVLDPQGQPGVAWNFLAAYPVKWSGPELRADSNTVAFETVELAHMGLARPGLSLSLGISAGISANISIGASAQIGISGSALIGF